MMYDIPGNIGWILYLTGYGRYLAKSGFTQHLTAGILLTVPVILIVIGIAELVSERIAKLDRILSSVRLFRGFGALTVGGFLGTAFPLLTFKSNFSAVNALMMSAGGILCFVFAWFINELTPKIRAVMTLVFYAPSMCSSIYVIWQYIFDGDAYGLLNSYLLKLNLIDTPIPTMNIHTY